MARIDEPEPGTVAWVDLRTPDAHRARGFYGALLGWSFAGGDDPSPGSYTMAQLGGRNVAGMVRVGPRAPSPPAWSVYFATADVGETARKVEEAGGEVVLPPTDVHEEGRVAWFADPTGATFGAWQGRRHRGAQLVHEPGAMTWHEVYTRDLPRARSFYERVLGLDGKRVDVPGMEYWTLHKGPRAVCGAMQMTEHFPPDVPSHWNVYFAVADADASARTATALGGTQLEPPFDTPYGRMTVLADPAGASFCLIRLSHPAP